MRTTKDPLADLKTWVTRAKREARKEAVKRSVLDTNRARGLGQMDGLAWVEEEITRRMREAANGTKTSPRGSLERRVSWRWNKRREQHELRAEVGGRIVATVYENGVWHTWNHDGTGGENWKEPTVRAAKVAAEVSVVAQGFDKEAPANEKAQRTGAGGDAS